MRGQQFVEPSVLDGLDIDKVFRLRPVLPVPSRKDMTVPFLTCEEMLSDPKNGSRPLSELAIDYESERGGLTHDIVLQKMIGIVQLLQHSIKEGVAEPNSRIAYSIFNAASSRRRWMPGVFSTQACST